MCQLLARHTPPALLSNDNLLNWQSLLRETKRPYRALLPPDDFPCLLFAAATPEPETVPGQAPHRHRWRAGLGSNLRQDKL
jgi:hypothetical protein